MVEEHNDIQGKYSSFWQDIMHDLEMPKSTIILLLIHSIDINCPKYLVRHINKIIDINVHAT